MVSISHMIYPQTESSRHVTIYFLLTLNLHVKQCRNQAGLSDIRLRCSVTTNPKASSQKPEGLLYENWEVSSEDTEGFFRKALALYVPKLSSAALLIELPELHIGLPLLH